MDSVELQQRYLNLFDSFKKISSELKKHDVIIEVELTNKGLQKLQDYINFNEEVYLFGKVVGMQYIKQTLELEIANAKIKEQENIIKTLEGGI